MSLYDELKQRLSRDFSADNLNSAATLATEASFTLSQPLGMFALAGVLRVLADEWDVIGDRDQSYMLPEALTYMETSLRPPIIDYLEASRGELTPFLEIAMLNEIVRALMKWTVERPRAR
jgi:hypothetical protein